MYRSEGRSGGGRFGGSRGGGSGGYGGGGGFRGGGGGGGFAPVKVGEELEVQIEAVGEKGDGIAKKNGFVLFVPGTKQGDTVKVRITKVLRKVGFAEVVGAGASSEGGEAAPAEESTEPSESSGEESYEENSEEPAADSEDFGESE